MTAIRYLCFYMLDFSFILRAVCTPSIPVYENCKEELVSIGITYDKDCTND